jgi:serine O-acetyltransferase
MFANLRQDAVRYENVGGWATHPGFWLGAIYRFGVWAHALRNPLLRIALVTLYRLVKLPWRFMFNVYIPPTVSIGPGLCLIHPSNILIGPKCVIGRNCLIFHEVTLGTGQRPGLPVIGDDVDLYVGARILGGVTIGDGSMVGANCVVTRSIPPGSVVASSPVRVIPRSLAKIARVADARASQQTEDEAAEPVQEVRLPKDGDLEVAQAAPVVLHGA